MSDHFLQDAQLDTAGFVPDIMTPEQFISSFHRRSRFGTPEERLILAILVDAVTLYFNIPKTKTARLSKNLRLTVEAKAWIEAPPNSFKFSFTTICEFLDIDPDYFRERLRRFEDSRQTIGAVSSFRRSPSSKDLGIGGRRSYKVRTAERLSRP